MTASSLRNPLSLKVYQNINSRLRNPKNNGFLIKESLEFPEDGRGNEMHTPGHRPWFFRLQKR